MMVSRLSLGAFRSFLLQGLVVSVETIVSNVVSLLNLARPSKSGRGLLGTSGRSCGFGGPALHGGYRVPGGFL